MQWYHSEFFLENRSMLVLIFWVSISCIWFLCSLLKVVRLYDLSVNSVHVSDGFPKKVWIGRWVVFNFFEFAQLYKAP